MNQTQLKLLPSPVEVEPVPIEQWMKRPHLQLVKDVERMQTVGFLAAKAAECLKRVNKYLDAQPLPNSMNRLLDEAQQELETLRGRVAQR